MLENVAYTLAGLGLYFMGMSGIRANLQRVPGRRFREFIGRATKIPLLAAFSGFITGMITQTSIGVSVILAGLIARGIATVPQALPVVAWSNFGLVGLVYLSNIPLHIAALLLLSLGALYIQFFPQGKMRPAFEPLYVLGLLLFGIRLMKQYCPLLAHDPAVVFLLGMITGSNILAFFMGALTRVVIQSSSTVVVLGIILSDSGIFTGEQALMVLFGTGLGTALAAYFLTSHFQGVMRQITIFEALINAGSSLIMLFFFYLEKKTHLPVFQGLLGSVEDAATESHLALFFVVQQGLCVVIAYGTLVWMPGWLERMAPTTVEQDLSRPRFISDEAVQDFETGLSLAEREWTTMLQRLPDYLQALRREDTEKAVAEPRVLHNSTKALTTELEAFLAALSDRQNKTHEASVALLRLQHQLSLLGEMENGIWEIVQVLHGKPPSGSFQSVESNVVEGLDAILRTSIEAIASRTPDDLEMLQAMTAAPGKIVDRLRRNYLKEEQSLDHDERNLILSVLSQYERIVWTLHQLSRSIESPK